MVDHSLKLSIATGLEDGIAVITASTSGIGLEIGRHMIAADVRAIVINGRNKEVGYQVQEELRMESRTTKVDFIAADLTQSDQVEALYKKAKELHGDPNILVHCCGAGISAELFQRTSIDKFRPLLDGHFLSVLHCCHFAVPSMIARGKGAIVTIASDAAKVATPGEAIIGGVKAAVVMFTRSLALEMSRHNVRANCITPSIVRETRAYTRVMSGDLSRRVFEKAESKARLGPTTPNDIAPLALFLAGDLSSRITGQAISVNGGISAA